MIEPKLLHHDEVSVTDDDGTVYSWWRGVIEMPGGGRKYFTVPLPIEGDRMEFLRRALEKQLH